MTRREKLAQAWSGVQRRAAIFEYPIRAMQERDWIETTDETEKLESELCRFFCSPTVADIPNTPFGTRP